VKQQKRFLHSTETLRFETIQTFSPTVKYFFKHHFKLRWRGKWTNSRHECQSLRYNSRSAVSGLLCSSGKIVDAFARTSPNSNVERASAWRASVAFVKRWGSQDSWVLVVMARQSECTGPWRIMKKGNCNKWAKATDAAIYRSIIEEWQSLAKRRTSEVFASSLPTRINVEHIVTKTIYQTSVLPVQLVLNKETKTPLTLWNETKAETKASLTLNGWMVETKASLTLNGLMVRICLNSNNIMGANVQNLTGHYSAVNWNRCVSHCGAAKKLLLCLFVYQLLSQQSRCVSRRNQIFQPNLTRWQARKTRRGEKSTRSSKMERRIRKNQKNKSARPPLSEPTFLAKPPQPNLISLDVCGQRKTNFSHEAYLSSSVARTLRNSSSSSTSYRWARLKSLGSRPAHNEHNIDNMRQPP